MKKIVKITTISLLKNLHLVICLLFLNAHVFSYKVTIIVYVLFFTWF